MDKRIKRYYILAFIDTVLMGASLGGSIVSFIIFLNSATGTSVGGRLLLLNIMSYVLLLTFSVFLILYVLIINKTKTIRLENRVNEERNKDNEK